MKCVLRSYRISTKNSKTYILGERKERDQAIATDMSDKIHIDQLTIGDTKELGKVNVVESTKADTGEFSEMVAVKKVLGGTKKNSSVRPVEQKKKNYLNLRFVLIV